MGWPSLEAASPVSVPPSTAPHPGQQGLTWEQEGGPGGDVDLLQMLQRLSVEEADGGARGEGHPDAAARLHHVRHAHGFILVRLEALLQTDGVLSATGRPAGRASGGQAHPTLNRVRGRGPQELWAKLTQPRTGSEGGDSDAPGQAHPTPNRVRGRGLRSPRPSSPNPESRSEGGDAGAPGQAHPPLPEPGLEGGDLRSPGPSSPNPEPRSEGGDSDAPHCVLVNA